MELNASRPSADRALTVRDRETTARLIARRRDMAARFDPTITCLNLRCKQMYYEVDEPEDGATGEPRSGSCDTAAYWCLRTQTGRGPDEKPVGREACTHGGRTCFEGVAQLT
jgi:hypothetical protein